MTGWLAIYRRELLSLWVTPVAWGALVVFLLLQGLSFSLMVGHLAAYAAAGTDFGPVQAYFGESSLLLVSLLLVCPALTMGTLAEERKSGTLETLMTAPVDAAGIVIGKFLAVFTSYALFWAPTVLYMVTLASVYEVSWPVVGASYLGVLGIGAGYLAVGVLMSSLTPSQLLAFVLTALVLFGLFIVALAEYVVEPGLLRSACAYVSLLTQLRELATGVVDSRRLVFDATLIAVPLFLAARRVEAWRWS